MIEIKNRYTGKVIYTHEGETLRGANLRYADLRYADLRGADLSYANLSEADLVYADLRDANLRYANLRGANLSYANLSYANLSYANLRNADLRNANLTGAITDQRYITISCIGSRKGQTTYCFDTDTIWCGCFIGTLQEFADKVEETHKDNPQYLKEYRQAIKFIKAIKEE